MAASLRTREEVRKAFDEAGLTVAAWADTQGFRRGSVYAVLAGRSKGRHGEAHRIAQALGLKAAPSSNAAHLIGDQVGLGNDVRTSEEFAMG